MSLKTRVRGAFYGAYFGPTEKLRRSLERVGRTLLLRRRKATYYHQPDDPYGHLWLQLLPELVARYPIDLRIVVVPVPAADVDPEPALRAAFSWSDALDLSRYYELEFFERRAEISESRLRRAQAVLLVDRPIDEQLRVARAVSDALLGGDGQALRRIVDEEGAASGQSVRPQVEANYEHLRAAGHYRGGVLSYGGEWYGSIDRLVRLEERFAAEGLSSPGSILRRRSEPRLDRLPALASNGRFELEVFHSFGSTYAYLALLKLRSLIERYPIDLRIRTIYPLRTHGVRAARVKLIDNARDMKREADRLGEPFGRLCMPRLAGIRRCAAVFVYAEEEGRALDFAEAAGRGMWSQAIDVTTDEGLRRIVEAVGLDWEKACTYLERPDIEELLEPNRVAMRELDLWGFPSFRLGEYCTWGQDRLELIEARLAAALAASTRA